MKFHKFTNKAKFTESEETPLPELEKNNYELEIRERFNDDDSVKWNSKNKILKLLETEVDKFIENEQDKILFRQKVMAFLNSESAKWS